MKKVLTLFFLSVFFLNGFSQNISEDKAVQIASNFLFGSKQPVKSGSYYNKNKESGIYIVNFEPEGWAIVSLDQNARPVIGYSPKGFFDVQEVSSNVKNWLNNQSEQIKHAEKNAKWTGEWKSLEQEQLPALKSATAVEPLLKTEWDQGAGWNRFCPPYAEGPNGKAFVGCVAVAMAQALYYLKFPVEPQGSKSYQLEPYGTISLNFDAEPEYNWHQMSLATPDDENARLLYHCAVAVEMDFGGDGSGAYTTRVPFAFRNYFGFMPSVQTISRYKSDDEWIALLKSELDKDNVLIYSGDPGTGEAGHAFNIDGYSNIGYFHFNWGWSGKYNGYFSIDNIAPGKDNFTKNQKAVIGITQPYWGPTDIALSNQTIKENMPAGTVVGNISVSDYSENDSFTVEVFGAPLFMEDGYAPAKFYEENMQLKSLEPLTAGPYPETVTIRVTDSDGNDFEKRFEITVKKVVSSGRIVTSEKFMIYPNPANNKIHIKNSDELIFYRIIAISGKEVLVSNKYSNSIDISSLQNGIYFLEVTDISGMKKIQKIIVNK